MKLATTPFCGHGWYGIDRPCPVCLSGDIPPGGVIDPRVKASK